MDSMKEYILRIVLVAIVSGILRSFVNSKTTIGVLVKMLCGIMMTITVISPLAHIDITEFLPYPNTLFNEAESLASDGKLLADSELRTVIIKNTESYILDKADLWECDVSVEVDLDEKTLTPSAVRISGEVSPYTKQRLGKIIEDDIGIPKERQVWS